MLANFPSWNYRNKLRKECIIGYRILLKFIVELRRYPRYVWLIIRSFISEKLCSGSLKILKLQNSKITIKFHYCLYPTMSIMFENLLPLTSLYNQKIIIHCICIVLGHGCYCVAMKFNSLFYAFIRTSRLFMRRERSCASLVFKTPFSYQTILRIK